MVAVPSAASGVGGPSATPLSPKTTTPAAGPAPAGPLILAESVTGEQAGRRRRSRREGDGAGLIARNLRRHGVHGGVGGAVGGRREAPAGGEGRGQRRAAVAVWSREQRSSCSRGGALPLSSSAVFVDLLPVAVLFLDRQRLGREVAPRVGEEDRGGPGAGERGGEGAEGGVEGEEEDGDDDDGGDETEAETLRASLPLGGTWLRCSSARDAAQPLPCSDDGESSKRESAARAAESNAARCRCRGGDTRTSPMDGAPWFASK